MIFLAAGIVVVLVVIVGFLFFRKKEEKQNQRITNIEVIYRENEQSVEFGVDSVFLIGKLSEYLAQYKDASPRTDFEKEEDCKQQMNLHYENQMVSVELFFRDKIIGIDAVYYDLIEEAELERILEVTDTRSLTIFYQEPTEQQGTEKIILRSRDNANAQQIYVIYEHLPKYTEKTAEQGTARYEIEIVSQPGSTVYYKVADSEQAQRWMKEIIEQNRVQPLTHLKK